MTTIYIRDKSTLPKRIRFDHYPTEPPLIQAALETLGPKKATSILDIGAGDGRWGLIAQSLTAAQSITGVDIRALPKPDGIDNWHTADFLTWQSSDSYDLIVSNPPYHIAEPVIRHAWPMLASNGSMLMLLRMAFQAGVKRYQALWQTLRSWRYEMAEPTIAIPVEIIQFLLNRRRKRLGYIGLYPPKGEAADSTKSAADETLLLQEEANIAAEDQIQEQR